jgi:CubicO group peptidase (beta-lactamase class C family)
MKRAHIPGLVYGVYRDGRRIESGAFGYSDIERNTKASTDAIFEIGSVTKQFTAAAILLLQQDGKLRLDDPVAKYLPGTPAAWKRVTLRHLLNHTSGIKNLHGVGKYLSAEGKEIREVASLPMDAKPGEAWSYSNTGYILLGYVVQHVSGKDYWDFLHERIFEPLGMTHTRNSDSRFHPANRAKGYWWSNGKWSPMRDLPVNTAFSAGALISTIDDVAKWDNALLIGKLLSPASLAEMTRAARLNTGEEAWTNASSGYGMGWFVREFPGQRIWRHSGGTGGFSSQNTILPDDHLSIVVLTNEAGWEYRPYVGERLANYFEPSVAPMEPRTLIGSRWPRVFVNGKFNQTKPSTRAEHELAEFLATLGSRPRWTCLESVPQGKRHVYRYRVFSRGEYQSVFICEANGRLERVETFEEAP